MALGRPELGGTGIVEHRSSPTGRWLHERRLAIAFVAAVVEGVFIAFDRISWLVALLLAAVVIVAYFSWLDRLRSPLQRDLAWIAAVSQALVAIVPALVVVVGTLALIAVALLALGALALLLRERR